MDAKKIGEDLRRQSFDHPPGHGGLCGTEDSGPRFEKVWQDPGQPTTRETHRSRLAGLLATALEMALSHRLELEALADLLVGPEPPATDQGHGAEEGTEGLLPPFSDAAKGIVYEIGRAGAAVSRIRAELE